jgi:hypothetical protein
METELEILRDKLHNMLDSNEYSYKEILKVSQDLDKLVVKYHNNYKKTSDPIKFNKSYQVKFN